MDAEQRLMKLLQDSWSASIDDVQCDQVQSIMRIISSENMSEADSRRRSPEMWRHFSVCSDCQREYDLLMALTQMEAAGTLEMPPAFPPVPQTATSNPLETLKSKLDDFIERAFPPMTFGAGMAVRSATNPEQLVLDDIDPIVIPFGNEEYSLDITLAESNSADNHAHITILFIAEDQPFDTFAGIETTLVTTDQNQTWVATVDDSGTVEFDPIPRGQSYQLQFSWQAESYQFSGLEIP